MSMDDDGSALATASDPHIRGFVRECRQRQAVGLVMRPGVDIPEALVDEAGHADLPLLVLPAQMTLSAFLRHVHESTGLADLAVLMQAMSVQTELIGALSSTDVEGELVTRISATLDVSAALFDHRREPVAVQGEAPVHLIADRLDSPAEPEGRLTIGRWTVALSAISMNGRESTLALAWNAARDIEPELVRSTQFAAQQLLRAHSRTVAASRLQDQAQRGQLLGELLEGVTDARLLRMRDGLVLLHFPREGSFQVHLMDGLLHEDMTEPDVVLGIVQDIAHDLAVPTLMGRHGNSYAVLHGASDAFTEELIARLPEREHGVSSAFHELTSCPSALRQAQTSLAASQRSGHFTAFHQVGFIDFILGHLPEDTLSERTSDVIGELSSNQAVMETLVEYFRCNLDIQETGRVMHLHPNSIRYRLSRAEDALGRSLTNPETIALLYLALRNRLASQQPHAWSA